MTVPYCTIYHLLITIIIEEVGDYNYGPGHPMKPHRIRMTHDLLVNYDVYKHLSIYVPSY